MSDNGLSSKLFYIAVYPFLDKFELFAFTHKTTGKMYVVVGPSRDYVKANNLRKIYIHIINCIHTGITTLTVNETEEVKDLLSDPKADDRIHEEPDSADILERIINARSSELVMIDLTPEEHFFALKSWVQAISEFGIDSFVIQREIELMAGFGYEILFGILRYITSRDPYYITEFIENVIKRCRYGGGWHAPSLTANLMTLFSIIGIEHTLPTIIENLITAEENISKYFLPPREKTPTARYYKKEVIKKIKELPESSDDSGTSNADIGANYYAALLKYIEPISDYGPINDTEEEYSPEKNPGEGMTEEEFLESRLVLDEGYKAFSVYPEPSDIEGFFGTGDGVDLEMDLAAEPPDFFYEGNYFGELFEEDLPDGFADNFRIEGFFEGLEIEETEDGNVNIRMIERNVPNEEDAEEFGSSENREEDEIDGRNNNMRRRIAEMVNDLITGRDDHTASVIDGLYDIYGLDKKECYILDDYYIEERMQYNLPFTLQTLINILLDMGIPIEVLVDITKNIDVIETIVDYIAEHYGPYSNIGINGETLYGVPDRGEELKQLFTCKDPIIRFLLAATERMGEFKEFANLLKDHNWYVRRAAIENPYAPYFKESIYLIGGQSEKKYPPIYRILKEQPDLIYAKFESYPYKIIKAAADPHAALYPEYYIFFDYPDPKVRYFTAINPNAPLWEEYTRLIEDEDSEVRAGAATNHTAITLPKFAELLTDPEMWVRNKALRTLWRLKGDKRYV